MTKLFKSLLAMAALTLGAFNASADLQSDGTYTIPGNYTVSLYNFDSDANPRQVDISATVTYEASMDKYILKEQGTHYLPYDVQFKFDELTNTLTFGKVITNVSDMTLFSVFNYDWGETTLIDNYKVSFDPATGVVNFPAEDYGFCWFPDAQYDWSFRDYIAQFEVNSFRQVAETTPGGGEGGEGGDTDTEWKDLGNATLMDGWILPLLGINQYDNCYEVLMQQNVENENLYRLVNPYKTGPAALYNGHPTKEGYIEFDVTDPEKVMFSYVYAGFSNMSPDYGEFEDIYCIDMWSWMIKKHADQQSMLNTFWKSYGYVNATYDAEAGVINLPGNGKTGYDLSYAACVGLPSQIIQEGDVPGGINWQDPLDGHFLDMTAKIIFPNASGTEPEPTEPTEGDIQGNMIAYVDMMQGAGDEPDLVEDPETFEVTASYDEETNALTIYNFVEANPITFTVNVEDGTAVAATNQVAFEEEGVTYYYASVAYHGEIKAELANDGENLIVKVEPFGEGADFGADFGWYNVVAYYNSVITLINFNIEGLPVPSVDPEDPDEPTEGDIQGNMIAALDMNQGMTEEPELLEAEEFEVTASYDAETNKLTIYNFAELKPITFTLNLENGEAVAEGEQTSSIDDYESDNVIEYFYGNVATKDYGVTAHVYPLNENQTVIYVDPWGEFMDFPGYGPFFNAAYFNTVVTLDYAIPGLESSLPSMEVQDINIKAGESDNQAVFTVSVSSLDLPASAGVTLYYKLSYEEDFMPAEQIADDAAAASVESVTHHTFTLDNIEPTMQYTVELYAQAGAFKSEVVSHDFKLSDQSSINGVAVDGDVEVRFFNLRGERVDNPEAGQIVIKVVNGKASKQIVK